MASGLYGKYAEACLVGQTHASYVQALADDLIFIFVSSGYVVNLATHQFISDIGGPNIVSRSGNLASKTATLGVFNCANETLAAVSGLTVTAVILAKNTGTDSTSPLMLYVDAATGLPDVPNGSDITVIIDPGSHHVFQI